MKLKKRPIWYGLLGLLLSGPILFAQSDERNLLAYLAIHN